MPDTAIRTPPLSRIQGQGVEYPPAATTALGTGIPAVNFDERAPIPLRFVLQLSHQLTPARVADALCQPGITDQVLDGQRLDTDHLVLADQPRRQLMQSVKSLVSNPGIDTGDFQACFLTIPGPLLVARKIALRQTTVTAAQMLRIGDLLAGTERGDIVQPHIHTHHRIDNG